MQTIVGCENYVSNVFSLHTRGQRGQQLGTKIVLAREIERAKNQRLYKRMRSGYIMCGMFSSVCGNEGGKGRAGWSRDGSRRKKRQEYRKDRQVKVRPHPHHHHQLLWTRRGEWRRVAQPTWSIYNIPGRQRVGTPPPLSRCGSPLIMATGNLRVHVRMPSHCSLAAPFCPAVGGCFSLKCEWETAWLTVWLAKDSWESGCTGIWLAGWFVRRLAGWMVYWVAGWLACLSVKLLTGWLHDYVSGWLTGWLAGWMTG